MSSHEVFLKTNGIYPVNSTAETKPFFTVSFLKDDVLNKNGEFKFKKSTELLNMDFRIETIST